MDYSIQVEVATIVLWNFFAATLNVVAFVILFMKANRNISLRAFFVVQGAMLIWLVGKVIKTVSPTEEIRWAAIVFYYFGICLLGASFLEFSYIYNKRKAMDKMLKMSIYLVALGQFLFVMTNPYHYLFYSRFDFWGDAFGKLFYLHMGITYFFIVSGLFLCSAKFRSQIKEKKALERHIITFAILAPLVLNIIYISGLLRKLFKILGIQVFDITPIVYTCSLLVFVYATFKYEFFDLTPIMKHEITSRLDTPVLIVDKNYNMLYTNKILKGMIDDPSLVIEQVKKAHQDNINVQGQILSYKVKEISKRGRAKYIITFNDITRYQMVNNELLIENQKLEDANGKLKDQIEILKQTSHIGARNYVARELHDIIGHSLVVTMKLLEVSKIVHKKDKSKAEDSLEKAKQSVVIGFEDIKAVRNKRDHLTFSTALIEHDIKTMLKTVEASDLKTNFYLRGSKREIEASVFDTITKTCKELVTNSLKHSGASNLFLSIVFETDTVLVQMMDNGKGTENLVKGNGLSGIDARVASVGGEVRYNSQVGEGFNASIVIPMISH